MYALIMQIFLKALSKSAATSRILDPTEALRVQVLTVRKRQEENVNMTQHCLCLNFNIFISSAIRN